MIKRLKRKWIYVLLTSVILSGCGTNEASTVESTSSESISEEELLLEKIQELEAEIEEMKSAEGEETEDEITANEEEGQAEAEETTPAPIEIPCVYPDEGEYWTSHEGEPYLSKIEITPIDNISFSYTLTNVCDGDMNSINNVAYSGTMTYVEDLDSNEVYFKDNSSGAFIYYFDEGQVYDEWMEEYVHDMTFWFFEPGNNHASWVFYSYFDIY